MTDRKAPIPNEEARRARGDHAPAHHRERRRAARHVGPARTSVSALAEHAGVRRSTVYRHFPDEASLFAACTAHWAAENPVPDIGAWAASRIPTSACARRSPRSIPTTGARQG